jgi:hypothetical protein
MKAKASGRAMKFLIEIPIIRTDPKPFALIAESISNREFSGFCRSGRIVAYEK